MLRKGVAELASAMMEHGVGVGDRVVVVASNSFDTLKVFLAVTALGGLFSSSSTDMGVQGILQRAVQVEPKVCLDVDSNVELYELTHNSTYSWTTLHCTTAKPSIFAQKCTK